MGLTLLAAVGVIASFVTIVGGAMLTQQLAGQIGLGDEAFAVAQVLRWPAVFVVLTAAVAILYRFAPGIVVPWRWILPGAAVFAVGWIAATAALGFYAGNVANYGATYGYLGAVIILMLWFYATAALLLVGAELTASLARELTPEEIRPRGEEAAAAGVIHTATDSTPARSSGPRVGQSANGIARRATRRPDVVGGEVDPEQVARVRDPPTSRALPMSRGGSGSVLHHDLSDW